MGGGFYVIKYSYTIYIYIYIYIYTQTTDYHESAVCLSDVKDTVNKFEMQLTAPRSSGLFDL
jgi:hypothetical protein